MLLVEVRPKIQIFVFLLISSCVGFIFDVASENETFWENYSKGEQISGSWFVLGGRKTTEIELLIISPGNQTLKSLKDEQFPPGQRPTLGRKEALRELFARRTIDLVAPEDGVYAFVFKASRGKSISFYLTKSLLPPKMVLDAPPIPLHQKYISLQNSMDKVNSNQRNIRSSERERREVTKSNWNTLIIFAVLQFLALCGVSVTRVVYLMNRLKGRESRI